MCHEGRDSLASNLKCSGLIACCVAGAFQLYYFCGDARCEMTRPCSTNSGLLGCACQDLTAASGQPKSPAPPPPQEDSCRYHGDGECDEPQFCAAGTDCSDCGRCGGHRRQMQRTLSSASTAGLDPGTTGLIEVLVANRDAVSAFNDILAQELQATGR